MLFKCQQRSTDGVRHTTPMAFSHDAVWFATCVGLPRSGREYGSGSGGGTSSGGFLARPFHEDSAFNVRHVHSVHSIVCIWLRAACARVVPSYHVFGPVKSSVREHF